MSLDGSKSWALNLLGDMKDDPLTQPTDRGGNHPLWLLGHIALGEAALLDECIQGKPNRFESWKPLFAGGTEPVPDASIYPSFDQVLEACEQVRIDSLAYLESLSDDDLDKPCNDPAQGPAFGTIGGCYAAMIAHTMHHAGQAADARRAAGKAVLAF